jgi:hypothetical protein
VVHYFDDTLDHERAILTATDDDFLRHDLPLHVLFARLVGTVGGEVPAQVQRYLMHELLAKDDRIYVVERRRLGIT